MDGENRQILVTRVQGGWVCEWKIKRPGGAEVPTWDVKESWAGVVAFLTEFFGEE